MQLGIYSLEIKKNRIGYYLFHMLIGVMFSVAIHIVYMSYFVSKSIFIYSIQILLIAFIGYVGGNFLMLRGNKYKKKYIIRGLLIVGATIGIIILGEVILRRVPAHFSLYKTYLFL